MFQLRLTGLLHFVRLSKLLTRAPGGSSISNWLMDHYRSTRSEDEMKRLEEFSVEESDKAIECAKALFSNRTEYLVQLIYQMILSPCGGKTKF